MFAHYLLGLEVSLVLGKDILTNVCHLYLSHFSQPTIMNIINFTNNNNIGLGHYY